MTDREMLELAAKAAGIGPLSWIEPDGTKIVTSTNWNPLTDDSDAFRLAVKLNLHISVFADAIGIGTPGAGYDELKYGGDPLAATRRAIVRAAAEIGKGMV